MSSHKTHGNAARPQNRIWIEIERPKAETDEECIRIAEERARAMSSVLRKLGFDPLAGRGGETVFWMDRKRCYCITTDEAGGFLEMSDSGHWFNLDRLAA